MERSVKNTIKEITRKHLLENNGLFFAQNVSAVGWIGGTVPELTEEQGIVELPNSDVSNSGVVVGAALSGRKPIYTVRYQGFQWYNCTSIINYAMKSKEMWGISCPIFVRSIAMENAIGPVAGSSHASLYYRMPGVKIYSPMTPNEYEDVYRRFMADDCVYYVSEHRGAFNNTQELEDIGIGEENDIVLLPISITRFEAVKARVELQKLGLKVGIQHQYQIKCKDHQSLLDINVDNIRIDTLETVGRSKYGAIVIDDDYVEGIAKPIAADIMFHTAKPVWCMGLENKSAGFHKNVDNLPPNCDRIVNLVKQICEAN